MASSYPNYYPQQFPYNRPNYMEPILKGRPVASIDEARASMIDFDGSIFYFPDQANKKIYTKQINIDGTSTLREYVLNETVAPTPAPASASSITKEEFEGLQLEVERLKELIAAVNAKSIKPSESQAANYKF